MGLLMLVSMLVLRGAELSGSASFGVVSQIKFLHDDNTLPKSSTLCI